MTIRRILLTLDGSAFAEAALPAAVVLASRANAELRLLSALEVPPIFAYPDFRSDDRVAAEAYLSRTAQRVLGVSAVSTRVREGRVALEILHEIREWNPDLVVMATHGRTGPSRLWIGSTADRCARDAERPLLLIRPRESGDADPANALEVERVVVPLDGSEEAEAAVPHALDFARMLDTALVFVRVVTYLDAPGFPFGSAANADVNRAIVDEETRAAEEALRPFVERARAAGIEASFRAPRDPQPGRAILEEAGRDLVVMTPRGLGRVERAFLGSTADKVIRGAQGPVLLVPSERTRPD